MKQLSALGARRQFFRNPRSSRLRVLDDPTQELLGPGFGYFAGQLTVIDINSYCIQCSHLLVYMKGLFVY